MSAPSTNRNVNPIQYTVQAMENWSFDEDFKQQTRELLGYDPVAQTLRRITVDTEGNLKIESDLIHTSVHTGSKELRVFSEGHVCADNSTSTPLLANATFTGGWQDTLDFSEVIVTIYTDQPSITDGLVIQWSTDGITVHNTDVFTISATSGKTFSFQCVARYVRVVYTNDGVAQTYFVLGTYLKRFASKGSSHRLADTLSEQDDAIATKSLVAGHTTGGGGGIVDVKVTPSGALTVEASVTSSTLPTGAATSALQTTGNTLLGGIAGLTPSAYDYVSLSYTGSNLTGVVFKTGGSGGTTVATLTLTYDGSNNLLTVTKT